MALTTHEVKVVSTSAVSPATTAAAIRDGGSGPVLMSTTQNIFWTADGATAPVATSGSEVGHLLRSTDLGVSLAPGEFLLLKMIRAGATDARVQFSFLEESRYRVM